MTNTEYRTETDSMGPVQVPQWAWWGASTQRAVENFPVSGRPIPADVVHAFGLLKAACAQVNLDLGRLSEDLARPIIDASMAVAEGKHDRHFPVDVYQTGSGTSSNMNANEVIANLANHALGQPVGTRKPVHPNDHVNMGQSSNDTFPTAMHVAAAVAIKSRLIPALQRMEGELAEKAEQWDHIVKIGRTHLMDATPIRMGQVFGGYARQLTESVQRATWAMQCMKPLAIGGTAVGTGINTHTEFGRRVAAELSRLTGLDFIEAPNHPEAQAAKDAYVQSSGHLRTIAVSLSKIANDIRWLGSGPRCGLFELLLPETQPGSSIMPGKVNPVICESLIMAATRVIANDQAVTIAGMGGIGSILELNVAMPIMADSYHEMVDLMTNGCQMFTDKLLVGLQCNADRCASLIDQSLMMVTSLAPEIGYDNAAKLAKQAFNENKTIRELCLDQNLIDPDRLNQLLDPDSMTRPERADEATAG